MSRLPASANVVRPAGTDGAVLHAPAAARNTAAIVALVAEVAPAKGRALEIASGTGQHAVALAQALPALHWHPSDIADTRLASIAARTAEAGLANLHPPRRLDACAPGWAAQTGVYDLILAVNLLHLIPEAGARVLLREAAAALAPAGRLVIYGPFLRDGRATSPGDAQFDADLRGADPALGLRDAGWLETALRSAGLSLSDRRDMPANNLTFIAEKGSS